MLVQRRIADELRTRLAAALGAVRIGPADAPATRLGPLIDKAAVARVDRIVEDATAYAQVIVRGGPVTYPAPAGGTFFRPALVEVEPLDVPLVQQEVFGPVRTFEVFEDEADAIRRANATESGLAASVFTADDLRARRGGAALRFGAVSVNGWALMTGHIETGGCKRSGIGVLGGTAAMAEFQHVKCYATAEPHGF